MNSLAVRMLPYALSFFSSLCIMILELVASRLVARHVGASLSVWTSVIGIMLGGICLGNVLGGRLADRVEPGRAIGPLYALGAFLSLSCLWINAIVGLTPGLEYLPWNIRTVVVVTLNFLVPATVLGMIGPVVAKIAVEQARKTGSAIGDVYFWGAIGSIVGTFLAGFTLMYLATYSTIVTLVAAALALLAAALIDDRRGVAVGWLASAFLGLGAIAPLVRAIPLRGVTLGTIAVNPLALVGHILTIALAGFGVARLRAAAACRGERRARGRDNRCRKGSPSGKPDRPGDPLVRREPGLHVSGDGGRTDGHPAPRVEHLRLDQRHRRPARRPESGQLSRRQDRRLHPEREAGELALPGGIGHDPLDLDVGDPATLAGRTTCSTARSRS